MAEFFATAVLVLLGVGVVTNVGLGPRGNFWGANWVTVSLGWCFAVVVAGMMAAGVTGVHLNPAVTFAMVAREKGLEPLADLILKQDSGSPEELAKKFLNEQVTNIEEALQGARDIVAEMISDNANVRAVTREKALKFGKVRVEKIPNAADEKAVYESY